METEKWNSVTAIKVTACGCLQSVGQVFYWLMCVGENHLQLDYQIIYCSVISYKDVKILFVCAGQNLFITYLCWFVWKVRTALLKIIFFMQLVHNHKLIISLFQDNKAHFHVITGSFILLSR